MGVPLPKKTQEQQPEISLKRFILYLYNDDMNYSCGCRIPQAHSQVFNQMGKNLKVIVSSFLCLKCAFRLAQGFLKFFTVHTRGITTFLQSCTVLSALATYAEQ